MVNFNYLKTKPGILTLISVLVGIIVIALAAAAWPRESVRQDTSSDATTFVLKFSIFFGLACGTLFFSTFEVLLNVTGCKKNADSKRNRENEAYSSIFCGLVMLIIAAILLHEVVSEYNKGADQCDGFYGKSEIRFSVPGIRSIKDDAEAQENCFTDNPENLKDQCYCLIKTYLKFSMIVAAGASAVLNSAILFGAAAAFFVSK